MCNAIPAIAYGEIAMTNAHTVHRDLRRLPGGSVDLDHYRAAATALRRHAMRDARTLRAVCRGLLALAGVLVVAFLVASGPSPASRGPAAVAQSASPQVW
jgi:hypothetical protein